MIQSFLDIPEGEFDFPRQQIELDELPSAPALMLASLHVVFPFQLAGFWRDQGLDVVIITDQPGMTGRLLDGTYVLSLPDYETKCFRTLRRTLYRSSLAIEKLARKTVGGAALAGLSKIVGAIIAGASTAHLIRQIRPSFVFGHQVYRSGFTLSLVRRCPTILMPYGQDIYLQPSSFLMRKFIQWGLRHVNLVCPASVVAASYLQSEFGVAADRVRPLTWGVDHVLFSRADQGRSAYLRAKYGIPRDATIITNVRRFDPRWGSETALEAFLILADRYDKCHFVILGGNYQEQHARRALERIAGLGLSDRFLIFTGGISLREFSEIVSITDVFTALMQDPDMRSASIVQAAASGAVPVLSDQLEYREMERMGFKAIFVNPRSVQEVVKAIEEYLGDRKLLEETRLANRRYVTEHEDYNRQMSALLDHIRGLLDPSA